MRWKASEKHSMRSVTRTTLSSWPRYLPRPRPLQMRIHRRLRGRLASFTRNGKAFVPRFPPEQIF